MQNELFDLYLMDLEHKGVPVWMFAEEELQRWFTEYQDRLDIDTLVKKLQDKGLTVTTIEFKSEDI